jgi:hypothetical protein
MLSPKVIAKSKVITKGAIVDLAAKLAGVTGTLTGESNYDMNAALLVLEYLMTHLEEQYGVFLGYKLAEFQHAQPNQDSGIRDANAYSVAVLLAKECHALFGVDQVTYQRLERQCLGLINRLTPSTIVPYQGNEQLPVGAGNSPYNATFIPQYFDRENKIDVEDDATLDLGVPYFIKDS